MEWNSEDQVGEPDKLVLMNSAVEVFLLRIPAIAKIFNRANDEGYDSNRACLVCAFVSVSAQSRTYIYTPKTLYRKRFRLGRCNFLRKYGSPVAPSVNT